MTDLAAFEPGTRGATPLFLDTSGLYPYFYDRASQHEEVTAFFEALAAEAFTYRPLLTNQYVADELVSLLLAHAGHETAATALDVVRKSTALTLLSVTDDAFEAASDAFVEYDDQAISLTDHTIGVQAEEEGAGHVLAYDRDFEALGLTVVPREG